MAEVQEKFDLYSLLGEKCKAPDHSILSIDINLFNCCKKNHKYPIIISQQMSVILKKWKHQKQKSSISTVTQQVL